MGLADSVTSVSAYAKGQATLALITERSAFAVGNFGKEADTAQGQQQRAAAAMEDTSAALGKSLLPIYTQIQKTITLVAEAFAMLPGPVQTGLIGLTGIVLIGPKLVDAFSSVVSTAKAAGTAMLDTAAKAVTTQSAVAGMNVATTAAGSGAAAAAGGMALLGPAALAVGVAAVVGGIAWKNYSDEQAAVKKDIDALTKTFNQLDGSMTANSQTTVGAILASKNQIDNLNKAGITVAQFSDVIDDNRDSLVKQGYVEATLQGQMEGVTGATEDRIKTIREAGGAQNELIARLIETGAADKGLIETLYNSIDAYNQQQETIRQLNIQKGLNEGKSEAQATAEANLAAEVEKSKDKIKDLIDATKELYGLRVSNEEAEISTRKALKEYNDSLKEGGLSADDRRLKELELQKAMEKQAETYAEYIGIQKITNGETYSGGEAALVQAGKLRELAATLAPDSPVRKHLEGLATALDVVANKDPVVKIRLETEEAIRKFKAFLRIVGADENAPGLAEILQYSSDYIEPRAGGGPVGADMPYLVGEKGPELFVPSGYGRIIDAFSTNKALLSNAGGSMGGSGGPAINVTINTVAGDPDAIERVVIDAIARASRRGATVLVP
jgi:hypothetical protein